MSWLTPVYAQWNLTPVPPSPLVSLMSILFYEWTAEEAKGGRGIWTLRYWLLTGWRHLRRDAVYPFTKKEAEEEEEEEKQSWGEQLG